jgi:ferric-dicitrate binding protein FerR (iron transport regulator)
MAKTGRSPEHYEVEDFVTDESFINYFFHLNEDDVLFWEKWILANPDGKSSVDAARVMLKSLTLTLTDREIDEETARIKAAIGFRRPPDLKKRPAVFRLLRFGGARRPQKIIVPLLLILAAGGYFITRLTGNHDRVIGRSNTSSHPIVFSLPDGTTVTLAPQSSLRYSSNFGAEERMVALNGEAQFDVTRKTDHPLKVQEGDILATVLGTKFSIRQPPGDSVIMVELINGKLKVENTNSTGLPLRSIILNPDERVVYDRHSKRLYTERRQPRGEFPLQVAHILFQRNDFDQIATKIKAVFGVNLVNKSKKRNWMFSGEFENATAQDIIKNICVVERLNFETIGDTVLIK